MSSDQDKAMSSSRVHRGKGEKMEVNNEDDEAPTPKSLLKKLSDYRKPKRQPFIYKAQNHYLRDINKLHEPIIVAIGPYHHGKESLKMMEQHKLRYLKSLLGENESVNRYLSAVSEIEEEARSCYAEDLSYLSSDEFIQMLVLDGCFIIELLRKFRNPDSSDPIFQMDWILEFLKRDLISFENQIPFFVLYKLFDLINEKPNNQDENGKQQLIDSFFTFLELEKLFCSKGLMNEKLYHSKGLMNVKLEEVRHLLHLTHAILCPSSDVHIDLHLCPEQRESRLIPSATELKDANVMFRVREPSATELKDANVSEPLPLDISDGMQRFFRNLFRLIPSATKLKEDISDGMQRFFRNLFRFFRNLFRPIPLKDANVMFRVSEGGLFSGFGFDNKGVLRMPPLDISDGMQRLFRNLILYEQYFPDDRATYVTDFVVMLDCLVNTAQDVEILTRCGIIQNMMGDNQVAADIINRLAQSAIVSQKYFIYADTFQKINAHHKRGWNRAMAALNRDYFNSPWAYISFFAALLLLILTLLQTVFSAP